MERILGATQVGIGAFDEVEVFDMIHMAIAEVVKALLARNLPGEDPRVHAGEYLEFMARMLAGKDVANTTCSPSWDASNSNGNFTYEFPNALQNMTDVICAYAILKIPVSFSHSNKLLW